MQIIKKVLKQRAVYWEPLGAGADGQQTYGPPIEIKVRWTEMTTEFITDQHGGQRLSNALVMVDRDVKITGILWLGKFKDLLFPDDPYRNEGALEIRQWTKIPTANAKAFYRKAMV